jgi:hypothetical protein
MTGVESEMKNALSYAVCLLVVLTARDAAAQVGQPWTDRGYFNLNGGFEPASGNLTDAVTRRIFDEDGTFSVAQPVDSSAFVDFSAGGRLWRNVSFGIGFHQGSTHSDASVQGSIPHPLFFNQPRAFDTSVADLKRTERAVHVQFGYMLVLSDRVSAHLMLGPSFFKLRQNVVSDVSFSEVAAIATVNVTPVVTERVDTPTGFNVGVDLGFQLYETSGVNLGAGLLIRYAAASADVLLLQNTVDSDVGGVQVGIGARVRF